MCSMTDSLQAYALVHVYHLYREKKSQDKSLTFEGFRFEKCVQPCYQICSIEELHTHMMHVTTFLSQCVCSTDISSSYTGVSSDSCSFLRALVNPLKKKNRHEAVCPMTNIQSISLSFLTRLVLRKFIMARKAFKTALRNNCIVN